MAIDKPRIAKLMIEAKRRPFSGHALQLGKQDIWVDHDELRTIAKRCAFELKYDGPLDLVKSQFLKNKAVVSDTYFFKSLGFDRVSSLDASDFEGANFVHDLNKVPTPSELCDRFDVIFEIGTLEHIFHLPNALTNIHNMLKVDGYVVHGSPCSNAFEHGFYLFSPCFFFDYYGANGYEILDSFLFRYKVNAKKQLTKCEILDCLPESEQLSMLSWIGSLDEKFYAINVIARKKAEAISGNWPQQGYYEKIWSGVHRQQTRDTRQATRDHKAGVIRKAYSLATGLPIFGPLIKLLVVLLMSRLRVLSVLRWRRIAN